MCGIYASASKTALIYPTLGLKQLLCNRGPDHVGQTISTTGNGETALLCISTVLALRGGHIVTQPLNDAATGSTLCWNGEAWKIGEMTVEGNDGEAVLALLCSKTSNCSQSEATALTIGILRSISGPSAFMFYDKSHDLLYFGRDCLGRRSLLYNIEDVPGAVQFSSVADSGLNAWKEVEADGIYVLDLTSETSSHSIVKLDTPTMLNFPFPLHHFSWDANVDSSISSFPLGKLNASIPGEVSILSTHSKSVDDIGHFLSESLKLRVLDIPKPPNSDALNDVRLAILFSGGIDCTVLARMAHDILPANQRVDLLNVAFENPRVVHASKQRKTSQASRIDASTPNTSVDVDRTTAQQQESAYEACPDRITGRSAVKELRKVCPGRTWRFVAINVPYIETLAHRAKVVSLIYPHNTEMDLSIAYALYFASRGTGDAATDDLMQHVPYSTPARVLLSGLGADELFGGYTRHATAFARHSFPGLIEELELDIIRLGKRNLGRDDRVISNWGREARYPYLDEVLIQWALDCPVWGKCGFGTKPSSDEDQQPDLESSKKVLRLLAWTLGMESVAREKKRAANSIWGENGKDGDGANEGYYLDILKNNMPGSAQWL